MSAREYYVIMPNGHLLFVEITQNVKAWLTMNFPETKKNTSIQFSLKNLTFQLTMLTGQLCWIHVSLASAETLQ